MSSFFRTFEAVSAIIFTVEYALRFISIGDEREYAGLFGRIKFLFSFYSIVDIAAIAPFCTSSRWHLFHRAVVPNAIYDLPVRLAVHRC